MAKMMIDMDMAGVDLLNLSPRVTDLLKHEGYRTIGSLIGLNTAQLAGIFGAGPAAVTEIVTGLENLGIDVPKQPGIDIEDGTSRARVRAIRPVMSRLVGENIRRIREERGMPRQMLAWELHKQGYNVSEAVLKNIELGMPGKARRPRWITVDEAAAFAEVLDIPVSELFH
jgi:Bacterial RNA polymerase, alpha chain C terminal domain